MNHLQIETSNKDPEMGISGGSFKPLPWLQPGRQACPGCGKIMENSTGSSHAVVSLSCSHRWCRSCVGVESWSCTERQNSQSSSARENLSFATVSGLRTIKLSEAEETAEHMVKSLERWSSFRAGLPETAIYVCEYCQKNFGVRFVMEKHKTYCLFKQGFRDTGSSGSSTSTGDGEEHGSVTAPNDPEDANMNSSDSYSHPEENQVVPVGPQKRKRALSKSLLPVKCSVCSQILSRKSSLQRHMKTVHPEIRCEDLQGEEFNPKVAANCEIVVRETGRRGPTRASKMLKLDPDLHADNSDHLESEATPEPTTTASHFFKVPKAQPFGFPDTEYPAIGERPLHSSTFIHS